jgi:hypothetical protein
MTRSRYRLVAVLVTLAVLGVVEWLASNLERLSPADLNRVQTGMTRAEVEAAFGQPPNEERPPSRVFTSAVPTEAEGATWVLIWDCRGGWIAVFLADDRVIWATFAGRIRPWERWRLRLRL